MLGNALRQRLANPFQNPRRIVRARGGYRRRGQRQNDMIRAQLRAIPRQELKFHDVDTDDAVIAAGSQVTVTTLNAIAQGTTESTRIGRRVVIKKISFRYDVSLPATASAAETFDVIRLMIVHDKQCNGMAADDLDILENADHQSFNNLANKKRFVVLMDRTHDVQVMAGSGRGSTDTLSYGAAVKSYSFYKNVNITIEYDDSVSTGSITSQTSSNLLFLTSGRAGFAGVIGHMRLRFHD